MTEDTRSDILRQAEFLIRTRGYAAFSYADLAQSAGITKASVHYHFPTKEDLVTVLVQHYLERFIATLADPAAPRRSRAPACATMPCCFSTASSRACCRSAAHFPPSAWPCRPSTAPHDPRVLPAPSRVAHGRPRGGAGDRRLRAGSPPDRAALLLLSTLEGGTFVGWALQQKATVLAAFEAAMRDLELSPAAPGVLAASGAGRTNHPGRHGADRQRLIRD